MGFNRPLLAVLLIVLAVAVAWWRLAPSGDQEVRQTRIIMSTVVEITALPEPGVDTEAAVNAAFAEMVRIEGVMSSHRADSEVSRLSGPVTRMELSTDTAAVIRQGLAIAKRSDGAFDLALGRLIKLWNVLGEHPHVPTAAAITKALRGVGPGDLRLEGRTAIKADPELAIDLGSIAKGYAVDRACAVLQAAGIRDATVNAGGNLRVMGSHRNRPWRIGIQHPRKKNEVMAILPVNDEAVVTSGDYQRFFMQDGVRYHHIFDPRTGWPARRCQSVTIVADNATLADGLSTAVFVLGPEKGLALARSFGVEALIIDIDGGRHMTDGLRDRLQWP